MSLGDAADWLREKTDQPSAFKEHSNPGLGFKSQNFDSEQCLLSQLHLICYICFYLKLMFKLHLAPLQHTRQIKQASVFFI